jgi:hypothetical protein
MVEMIYQTEMRKRATTPQPEMKKTGEEMMRW